MNHSSLLMTVDPGWRTGFPLPLREQADRMTEINEKLGYETAPPEETPNGWVVRWRPREEEGYGPWLRL